MLSIPAAATVLVGAGWQADRARVAIRQVATKRLVLMEVMALLRG